MKYVSMDLETTGLDPNANQILEIGAVIEDTETMKPLAQLPRFHAYILPGIIGGYFGDPFALQMNVEILRKIAEYQKKGISQDGYLFLQPETVGANFSGFLEENGFERIRFVDPIKIIPAGKNFASFDRPFLMNLPEFGDHIKFHHRTLDPLMYFLEPKHSQPPNTEECLMRMGVQYPYTENQHTALHDAEAVVQMIRFGLNGMKWDGLPDNWSK